MVADIVTIVLTLRHTQSSVHRNSLLSTQFSGGSGRHGGRRFAISTFLVQDGTCVRSGIPTPDVTLGA